MKVNTLQLLDYIPALLKMAYPEIKMLKKQLFLIPDKVTDFHDGLFLYPHLHTFLKNVTLKFKELSTSLSRSPGGEVPLVMFKSQNKVYTLEKPFLLYFSNENVCQKVYVPRDILVRAHALYRYYDVDADYITRLMRARRRYNQSGTNPAFTTANRAGSPFADEGLVNNLFTAFLLPRLYGIIPDRAVYDEECLTDIKNLYSSGIYEKYLNGE